MHTHVVCLGGEARGCGWLMRIVGGGGGGAEHGCIIMNNVLFRKMQVSNPKFSSMSRHARGRHTLHRLHPAVCQDLGLWLPTPFMLYDFTDKFR